MISSQSELPTDCISERTSLPLNLVYVALLLVGSQLNSFAAATFQGLGDLPGGSFLSYAFGVADGGKVVTGVGRGAQEGFRWTPEGGMVGLGNTLTGGYMLLAFKMSRDGSVIAGYGSSANGIKAVRWANGSGSFISEISGGGQSDARAVSSDGVALAGYIYSANGVEAYRWTSAGGMELLGDLPGGIFISDAYGVSDGGEVVVGVSHSANGPEAFRWKNGIMEGLGVIPGGDNQSAGLAVNPDGSVVVGYSSSAAGRQAFRWTRATGMVGLGDLSGGAFLSIASSVSGDGSVVVGGGTTENGGEAFIWDSAHGIRNLRSVLSNEYGLGSALDGWQLDSAAAVSTDGTAIVGGGRNPSGQVEAWLVTLPPRSEPDVTPPTINCPANLFVGCSVEQLTSESYPAATASDESSPPPVLTCAPPSDSPSFVVGVNTVVCTAVDAAGNMNSCSFDVTRAPLGFTGFLAPIGGETANGTGGTFADPVRAFKFGSTIPVKFRLSCDSSPIANGIHTLQVIKYSNETDSDPAIDATPTDAATTGNEFRLTDPTTGAWHFNLNTKPLSVGTWKVAVRLSDGSVHEVWITIKN